MSAASLLSSVTVASFHTKEIHRNLMHYSFHYSFRVLIRHEIPVQLLFSVKKSRRNLPEGAEVGGTIGNFVVRYFFLFQVRVQKRQ